MTAKQYYNSTRLVETKHWTLEMAMAFAEEYADELSRLRLINDSPPKDALVSIGALNKNVWGKEKVDCNYCGKLYPDTMCRLHPAPCQKIQLH